MAEERCLNPKCERKATARGLCDPCYAVALDLVRRKKTTWDKLEAQAKVSPKKYRQSTAREWLLGSAAKKKGT